MIEHDYLLSPTQEDLEYLDEFLLNLDCDDSYSLSEVDGLLTASCIGPEIAVPPLILSMIWGSSEPNFKNKEAEKVIGTIFCRQSEIAANLVAQVPYVDGIFMHGPKGQIIVEDWIFGFTQWVERHEESWKPLIQSAKYSLLLRDIFLLGFSEEQKIKFQIPLDLDRDKLIEHGHEVIPELMVQINAFWKKARSVPSERVN